MLLNTVASGPQCWLFLAQARGYLAEAGVALDLTPGKGAYNAAPGVAADGYDLGYGDVHALVDVVARDPGRAPIGIFAMFNASPSAIAVARDGPVAGPGDLAGRHLIGHASDVALRTFPAFCAANGVDAASVRISPAEGALAALAERVLGGDADGLFGYVSTITASYAAAGLRAEDRLRFLRYDRLLPDAYGSMLMASARLVRDEPALLRRVVAALSRGLADALADPDAAIAALHAAAPQTDPAVERLRWDTTLAVEMAHPEAMSRGFGGIDPARFARGIALHATASGLPRSPGAEEVFTDVFLPPIPERAVA
ncbi:ABC transporter substrate-binding protein [Humitalea sp. 24SJ18S-53]|uniref:ABC transporter substrate-binding protein n=1 Tax=Humitalea sp. 24SJ18S-53 TaxID=3422307 RepID=UPI003D6765FD